MNRLFRGICWNLTWICAVVLCAQLSACELDTQVKLYQSIEDVELERRVDQLLLLIQKRLAIMHEVAKTKWHQHLPIEDKGREQKILADLVEKARQYNLNERWAAAFFQVQMDAAKKVQSSDFFLWETQGQVDHARVFSLQNELRSYIDQLNQEMLMILSQIDIESLAMKDRLLLDQPISTRSTDSVDGDIWRLAISPLKCDK